MPMCLLCQKVFTNDAMKPSKMKDHLERVHPDKKNKDVEFFKVLKEKIRNQPNLKSFFKAPGTVDCEGGLKASYTISLNIANKRRIDEMASDVEKMLVSELQHSKFSIQLNESAFGCSNILMAYVRYYSESLKCIVDEFLFANYLKGDAKGETIFRSLEDYLKEHNVPFRNITAVATDGAPAMVGRYGGFATLLKETVPDVRAVHCMLHRHHLVAKNLSGELHAALKKLEEGAHVSDQDLETYINHLEKLEEDFKIGFEDLESMTVPDWIIAPFDIETGNANIEFSLQEEHVEMSADLEAELLFKHKSLSKFWSSVNITNKYPKLSAAAQPFLLAFPSSYQVEAGFSHVNAILSKQRNILNLEMRGDFRLKLTNFQPNINALAAAHQTHPSH
ncbi:putative zinc finger protein [Trichinella spiralis]|uniref:putative zinc finger protein n=1 Tax=Trichinella spiralis TaxID=6334 RepID=UPI0001EFE58A|nr:putative zinc finger protein [Trichinella spiralis]